MPKSVALTGNGAVTEAMRQVEPDVVSVYPITPQTTIVEEYSNLVANGIVRTEFVPVESEHSAMSVCIGAAASGARTITATCGPGFALMWEMLYVASGLRLPIVMSVTARALSAPINIHCDHSDVMGGRDSGWVQLFAENAQEAYDLMIQSVRLSEHKNVRLPVMVIYDGFIISHAIARLDVLDDDQVKNFIGEQPKGVSLIDAKNPISIGNFDGLYGVYFEFKRQQEDAMLASKDAFLEIAKEYKKISGREYGLFETYMLDDAEVAVVVMASTAGTAKSVIDEMRAEGKKVGLLKPTTFRPFPASEIAEALNGKEAVAVLDRSLAFTGLNSGPLFIETKAALYNYDNRPKLSSYIFGLGGRDIYPRNIRQALEDQLEIASGKRNEINNGYLNFKE